MQANDTGGYKSPRLVARVARRIGRWLRPVCLSAGWGGLFFAPTVVFSFGVGVVLVFAQPPSVGFWISIAVEIASFTTVTSRYSLGFVRLLREKILWIEGLIAIVGTILAAVFVSWAVARGSFP